ncbi:MAG: IS1595 family transposase [Rhizomicrobium sp.]|jgi:transposase-like protein
MSTSKRIHQMTVPQWEKAFPDDAACMAYLAKHRWPSEVYCPRCGSTLVRAMSTMEFKWQCYACDQDGYRFSVLVGTVFENTNIKLRMWFRVIHRMLVSKKGVSAHQIYREMGFGSYRTAWHMCMRIRAGLADKNFRKLMGIVEVDETFIGGHDKNRHFDKKKGIKGGDKFIVIGAVERKGNCVARVINNVRTETLEQFIAETVSTDVSLLATDDANTYQDLWRFGYNHGAVNHSKKKYVIGAVHTNTIEGFWSLIKRGVMGTFHKVSKKYLPLYVAEFQFRYNNRLNADIFAEAIRGC